MASSRSSTAGSSGDPPGAADEKANAARVLAAVGRAAATAVANAAEAVGPEADNWNEAMRDAVAAQKRRDAQLAEAIENDTARVSADQQGVNRLFEGQADLRGVKRPFEGQAKPPVLDWLELSHQNELQRFYRTNPGDAPPIIPGRDYYLLAPGVHPMEDLANPGRPLVSGCASYRVIEQKLWFHYPGDAPQKMLRDSQLADANSVVTE